MAIIYYHHRHNHNVVRCMSHDNEQLKWQTKALAVHCCSHIIIIIIIVQVLFALFLNRINYYY